MTILGEVIEVQSLVRFRFQQTAGEEKLYFGAFVKTGSPNCILGIVSNVQVLNPNIGVFPRPKRIPQIKLKNVFPDLFDQFPTLVEVMVLGFKLKDKPWVQDVPPRPPKIYGEVHLAPDDDVISFVQPDTKIILDFVARVKKEADSPLIDSLIVQTIQRLEKLLNRQPGSLMRVINYE